MEWTRRFSIASAALCLSACAGVPPPPVLEPPPQCEDASAVSDSVFLIGDAGAAAVSRDAEAGGSEIVDPVLRELARDVAAASAELGAERISVVYLGDNVYPRGLRPEGERGHARDLRVLAQQVAAVGPARGYFVAGNHDWANAGPSGWDRVVDQSRLLGSRGPRIAMWPPGGCAGPIHADVGEHLRLLFLDVIGWSHAYQLPEQHGRHCPRKTALEVYYALADEFDHPDGRHVALVTHYPLITTGPHGGHFTWVEHLFPLRDIFGPNWWIPLPVIGSIYPVARLLGATGTDLSSEIYQQFIRSIDRTSRPGVPLLFAAGHEHSLQVHRDPSGVFYAVSGAGSREKVDRVRTADTLLMGRAEPGYMRLDLHGDGSLALTVLALHGGEPRRPVYRACLATGAARSGPRLSPPVGESARR